MSLKIKSYKQTTVEVLIKLHPTQLFQATSAVATKNLRTKSKYEEKKKKNLRFLFFCLNMGYLGWNKASINVNITL